MKSKIYRFQCGWCKKSHFTVEENREYCTDQCKYKFLYAKYKEYTAPSILKNAPKSKNCSHCGNPCSSLFCSHACLGLSKRKPLENHKKAGGNLLAYLNFEEAEKKAERKRVFDDKHYENYIRRRTRDKI